MNRRSGPLPRAIARLAAALPRYQQVLADVLDAHSEPLGSENECPLPGRATLTALEVGLDPREGLCQVALSNGAQHPGHHDVGDREVVRGDPLAAKPNKLSNTQLVWQAALRKPLTFVSSWTFWRRTLLDCRAPAAVARRPNAIE